MKSTLNGSAPGISTPVCTSMDAVFEALTGLPTYRVERVRKVSNTRRLMALSRLLTTMHEVDMTAWDGSKKLVIDTLDAELARLKKDDPNFDAKVKGSGQITLNAVIVEQGTWKEIQGQTLTVPLDEKNIDDLFNRAGQRLGEGLHLDYWQTHYDQDEADEMPSRSRLELFLMLQDEKTWKTLEAACKARCEALLKQNKAAIKKLTTAEQEEYNKAQEVAKDPDFLVVRKDGDNHIVDILEPHSPALSDNYAKAKGLAQFAAKHAMAFGRIEMIRMVGKDIRRLDLIDAATRKKVLKVDSDAGLDLVFDIVNA